MAKGKNQKLKLLYLLKILMEETDESHGLTRQELLDRLASHGVNADRKTLYTDFEELRTFGIDVLSERHGNDWFYYIGSREFELAELKLLVDTVQSAKFITERKSQALINKLESLVSRHEAGQLHRQVLISGRIKTMNESVYYNVDKIHAAISSDSRIQFQYFQWNVWKEMVLRHDGASYHVSPWALVWDNENYYLIGYDMDAQIIKHFRVDRMMSISLTDQARAGREYFDRFDLARYTKRTFGMFGGKGETVRIRFHNRFVGVVIDRFGRDVAMKPDGEEHFIARVEVAVSEQFYGWITGLGRDVEIISPDSVVEGYRNLLKDLEQKYK